MAEDSATKVVNLYREPYDVYVGRAGKGHDGFFGNPCVVGRSCPVCGRVHRAPEETIPCFEKYANARILKDPQFRERVGALRGKTLGCFCKPKSCHGDVLAKIADRLTIG